MYFLRFMYKANKYNQCLERKINDRSVQNRKSSIQNKSETYTTYATFFRQKIQNGTPSKLKIKADVLRKKLSNFEY